MRHFLRDDDITPAEQRRVLQTAARIAQKPALVASALSGSAIGLMFQNPSLRTRVSSEVACARLGAHPVQLRVDELHFNRGENLRDSALVLGGYLDLLIARVSDHALLEELAQVNALPVVNGLSHHAHPLQALADLLTLGQEWNWEFRGKSLVYVGDGNNVACSILLAGAMAGLNVTVATPPSFAPPAAIVTRAQALAAESGAGIQVVVDPLAAAFKADALYTDVWTSMGFESEESRRRKAFAPYQLNSRLLNEAKPDAIVLHCLPAHRDEEISGEVLDCAQSRIIRQAHNRLPATAALMLFLLAPSLTREIAADTSQELHA